MKRRNAPRGRAPQEVPFDRVEALARFTAKLSTMTARGFSRPPFRSVVFGPVVHVDPDGDDPCGELRDKTLAEVARRTKRQVPT
jgi:hypothetical protein